MMPGTPVQPAPKPKEEWIVMADRNAREIANQSAHPLNSTAWAVIYWNVMAGYGFRPYIPGAIAEYHWR